MPQSHSTAHSPANSPSNLNLTKYAWLSIAAAAITITMKVIAWKLTGSVGLLSDAAESVVNLAAAILALIMLTIAARPADGDHNFGHAKAEYFSAAFEGLMILIAAILIIVSAVERLVRPAELESLGWGALISFLASVINGTVGFILIRAGRKFRSPTLIADGKHLWTDVVTSAGVIVAIILVWITGWTIVDPIIALLVAANIIFTGSGLLRHSASGLMDETLPDEDNAAIATILASHTTDDVMFHGLRTRMAGRARFAVFDVLVPGAWTVQQGHNLIEEVEAEIEAALPGIETTVHLEPKDDPRSYADFDVEIPIPVPADNDQ